MLITKIYLTYYDWEKDECDDCALITPGDGILDSLEAKGGYDAWDARGRLGNKIAEKGFGSPGRRNDDAVNACILLYCLGFTDTLDKTDPDGVYWTIEELLKTRMHMTGVQADAFLEHVERIIPYLHTWMESGHILDYLI